MKDAIDTAANLERSAHIVLHKLKRRPVQQMLNIFTAARDQIVKRDNLMTRIDKPIAQV